jgi:Flp pilus assembly protein TadG
MMKTKQPIQDSVRERGVVLFLGILSLVVIIPMMGLAVDVGYLYASKARLQAAVDGSALAAARALNLGQTLLEQEGKAKQNAVNWFYANFPTGNWNTTGTNMSQTSVTVTPAPGNPNLINVRVTASTRVPTFFMRYLNIALHRGSMITGTTISSLGNASRRDAVIMLVLDRSTSMTTAMCNDMKTAARLFTGQFANGRDYIGMVSFSDGTFVHSPPVQNFRTVLGYTSGTTTGTGAIDTITCTGNTGSAQALITAYNLLYRRYLPSAFNILVFESDGLPNTLVMNTWDGTSHGLVNRNGCKDASVTNPVGGKTKSGGGWTTAALAKPWHVALPLNGITADTPHAGILADVPAGSWGAIPSNDPTTGTNMQPFSDPIDTSGNSGVSAYSTTTMLNCSFTGTMQTAPSYFADFQWLPGTDVFGNDLRPTLNPYKTSFAKICGHLPFSTTAATISGCNYPAMSNATMWQYYHDAALNATDHAAYRARSNATVKPYVFAIGLGTTIDHTLMQRIANDTRGDIGGAYVACSANSACVHYNDQYTGTYYYAPNSATLIQKFQELSSQILRLSQ